MWLRLHGDVCTSVHVCDSSDGDRPHNYSWVADRAARGSDRVRVRLDLVEGAAFTRIPDGMVGDSKYNCMQLLQATYGLKQESREWNETTDEICVFDQLRSVEVRPVSLDQVH